MATIQTLAAVSATAGTPTPIATGTVTAAISFSITGNVATIVMGSLPDGYEAGKSITLWGFTTGTYFNGQTVTVISNNPATLSFTFKFTHANVGSTNDAGNTAPIPYLRYRGVRLEADKGNSTHAIYVGDQNVTASRYTTQLLWVSGAQQSIWFGGPENIGQDIDPSRIFVDTDNTGSKVQVTLLL